MFRTIDDFVTFWTEHARGTEKVLAQLSDQSLTQPVSPGGRTLGRLAWHIVLTIPEMLREAGLSVSDPPEPGSVPLQARKIHEQYAAMSRQLTDQVRSHLTDADLLREVPMYGESWSLGKVLAAVVVHEVHHRGQLTVLMRQAGLPVPGVYGPSREEWAAFGMQPPAV